MHLPHIQSQRLHPIAFSALLFACLVPLGAAVFVEPLLVRFLLVAFGGLMALVLMNFDRLTILVALGEVRVGYPVLKSRIAIKNIETAEVVDRISALSFGGLGLRISLRGEMCYLTRSGPGIRLRVRGRRGALLFTCPAPKQVLEALELANQKGVAP